MNKRIVMIFKGVAAAMGIAVVILGLIGTLTPVTAETLLGTGLTALAIVALQQ